ncbi:restriction endonuclease [Streptomyces chartreusis]
MTLVDELHLLRQLIDPYSGNPARSITPQTRGRVFEEWLRRLLRSSTEHPRANYRPKGEEIDGSFGLDGRIYLLEAKWHGSPLPASSIYQFRGKVDGKLVGTVGVFVSMSDYSTEAVEAVRIGKVLNVILFGPDDIEVAAEVGFAEVLRFKLRAATEEGEIYMPYVATRALSHLTILVEGKLDQEITHALLNRALSGTSESRPYSVVPTMGRMGIPSIAAVLSLGEGDEIAALVETDGMSPKDSQEFLQRLEGNSLVHPIMVDPGVERWVGMSRFDAKRKRQELHRTIERIDTHELIRNDSSFAQLIRLLTQRT